MPEITQILTDDHDNITHLLTEEEEYLSVEELARKIDDGEDYYVTFGEEDRYTITMVAEDGHLEPTIDDDSGEHSIWDLPQAEDPAEEEILNMYDRMERMGEFDTDELDEDSDEDNDEIEKYR